MERGDAAAVLCQRLIGTSPSGTAALNWPRRHRNTITRISGMLFLCNNYQCDRVVDDRHTNITTATNKVSQQRHELESSVKVEKLYPPHFTVEVKRGRHYSIA